MTHAKAQTKTGSGARCATRSRVQKEAQSRAERWRTAAVKAIIARSDLDDAIAVLADLRDEYEEWRDNVPENLHGSPMYEKLEAICDLDIDRDAILESLDFLDEADGIDLPLGFGRD